MSIKNLSQVGKHQDVSHLSWPGGWWSVWAKRQVRFICLGPFRLGWSRHQKKTDRDGLEECVS